MRFSGHVSNDNAGKQVSRGHFWSVWLAIVAAYSLALAWVDLGFTDVVRARRVLEAQGYDEVDVGGYVPGCGEFQCTRFVARRPRHVTGVVACGWFFDVCEVKVTGADR